MSRAVLDASVVLAVLFEERGAEKMTDEIMDSAVISAVNLAEVQSQLVKMGHPPENAWSDAHLLETDPEPFTADQAKIAGSLIAETAKYGLSLGDRSCLALAVALNAPVYTTEQVWKDLKVGVPIHVIR
ncbi:MAG: type II toxin-antitoxin system VapC family toxin [Terracidiphilus sp.]|jgi:PIN domain nuclease of toxin-antitoxin system